MKPETLRLHGCPVCNNKPQAVRSRSLCGYHISVMIICGNRGADCDALSVQHLAQPAFDEAAAIWNARPGDPTQWHWVYDLTPEMTQAITHRDTSRLFSVEVQDFTKNKGEA